jgi:PAS domain S-box-containing protein
MNQPKILVVEDESIVSLEIQSRLEDLGYEIAGAVYSGEDAVTSSKELIPDLILMDINLRGEIDGIEAANTIKGTLNIPIIYMTAYADDETIQRAKVSEPYAYIIKPIEVRELHTSIEIALFKSKMEKKLVASEKRFRGLFENATLGLYRTSLNGEILMGNTALVKMLGYDSLEELSKRNVTKEGYLNPERRMDFINELEVNGSVIAFEAEWRKSDGSVIYVSESASKNIDEFGNTVIEGTVEDITERKKSEIKLKESKELLQAVYDNVYNAILIHDENGIILDANEKVFSVFNIDREKVLGASIMDFSGQATSFEEAKAYWEKVLKGENQISEWKLKNPVDNSVFDVEVFLTKINYNGKDYILANVRDITEQKMAKLAIIKAKEAAEKSDQLKSDFLAGMSHEIRTPVNTILSYSSLLKDELREMGINHFSDLFHSISFGGKRLIRTVDSILNMSQIQTGTFDLFIQDINLEEDLLFPLYSEFKVEANNKGLNLILEKGLNPSIVKGDSYALGQLFTNLIDNAIKYTNEGEVKISTYKNEEGVLFVDVSDTGIGISEEFLENIFNPFTQETQGYTRRFDGNGLGLALVKRYANLNNADVSIKSKKGVGTTFTVEFKN